MEKASYKEMLKIPNTVHSNVSRDSYNLDVVIKQDDYANPSWLKLVRFVKGINPKYLHKVCNAIPTGYYDTFRLDSFFDGYLPETCLCELVSILDELCKELPYMDDMIDFYWQSSLTDY